MPPYPWLALVTCVAAPLAALWIGLETGMFSVFRLPLGMGASVPVGYLAVAFAAFPLMMPRDVRYLAAVVSMVPLGLLGLLWFTLIGPYFLPTLIVLFFAWVTNHPRVMTDLVDSGRSDESGRFDNSGGSGDSGRSDGSGRSDEQG